MSTSTNSFANQLDSESARNIFDGVRALDTGIKNHEAWISRVHQTLICHSQANPADLLEDAHCRCKFGQWLNSPETEKYQELDAYQSVVKKHQFMHELARSLLLKSINKQDIHENDYTDFTQQATDFKLDVRNLQYDLMSYICVVDHLTGAWNRHSMYSKLHQEKERLTRSNHSCTICMMDIDHFKQINDNYDHETGDRVLKSVIDFCHSNLRKYDSIYRYGGEEFLFCLTDTRLDKALTIIERLRNKLENHIIQLNDRSELSITASFGVTSLDDNVSIEDSIRAADHAMLCAKAEGRNRVCCWENDIKPAG